MHQYSNSIPAKCYLDYICDWHTKRVSADDQLTEWTIASTENQMRRLELHAIRSVLSGATDRNGRERILEFEDLLKNVKVKEELVSFWRAYKNQNLEIDEKLPQLQRAFAGLSQIAVESTIAQLRGG